jgi:hypothetical protein
MPKECSGWQYAALAVGAAAIQSSCVTLNSHIRLYSVPMKMLLETPGPLRRKINTAACDSELLTHHPTLTAWGTAVLGEDNTDQKFPHPYGTQRYITVFTRTLPWVSTLSDTNPIHSLIHQLFNYHINTSLVFPSKPTLSGFPLNILYLFLLSPTPAICTAHLTLTFDEE